MKQKYLLNYFFVFCVSSFYSQNQNIYGEVTYEQTQNHAIVGTTNYMLYFDYNKSYYKEIIKRNKNTDVNVKAEFDEDGSTQKNTFVYSKNKDYHFYFNSKKGFYFRDIYLENTLLVKENDFNWKWKLYAETKKIGRFTCQKASIKFRGRKYIAWFTDEIPVSFGPWKFRGLSGLILEVYEEEDRMRIMVKTIKISNEITDLNMNIDFSKSISLKEYINKKEKIRKEYLTMLSSKLPKGSKPYSIDCDDCAKDLEIFNEEN